MKILLAIPGHLPTVPMGGFCASALRRMGHQVVLFDYRPHWPEKVHAAWRRVRGAADGEAGAADQRLRRVAHRERPDLFLTLYGFDIGSAAIRAVRELGCVTACWWLNDPFQLSRSLRRAGCYDFYFTNARGCLAQYREAGLQSVHFLPLAVDAEIHRRPPLSQEDLARCGSDVCFAGEYSPLREELIRRLLDRHQVRVWGPWGKKLAPDSPVRWVLADGFFTPAEMSKYFAAAKVVLNLHGWYGRWPYMG